MSDDHLDPKARIKALWLLCEDGEGYEWLQPASADDIKAIVREGIKDYEKGGNA